MRCLLIALVAFGVSVGAVAQERPRLIVTAKPSIPPQFNVLVEAYRDWKPEYTEEPFANSVFNWANRAFEVVDYKRVLVSAARNWLFMRSEQSFKNLVAAYKTEAQELFGTIYLSRAMQTVFSKAYTAEVDTLYADWYRCLTSSKATSDSFVGEEVLHHVNNNDRQVVGFDGECTSALREVSLYYGVVQLSVDDLTALGFLHRRHIAHANNPRFVSAEVIRKAVYGTFEEE